VTIEERLCGIAIQYQKFEQPDLQNLCSTPQIYASECQLLHTKDVAQI